ncbi:MAG TPA: VOC family protein [Polyangiaceae bacterium]|nr:VOC family protein [Polyangiaceae bacterium]
MKPRRAKKSTSKPVPKKTAKVRVKAKAKTKTKTTTSHSSHGHAHPPSQRRPSPPVRPQPLIAVRNVEASSRWYARLLGAENLGGDTHGNLYDRVLSRDRLILQLHAWDREDHPNLVDGQAAPLGHGVLLWFEVDDFDAAVERARALEAEIVQKPHVNPGPQHREIWLRDPDGYVVVVASPDGEAGVAS